MDNILKRIATAGFLIIAFSNSALATPINTDFEIGSLTPWYQDNVFSDGTDWEITTSSIAGTYSAFNIGNMRLRQDFAGITTDDILSITFNLLTSRHDLNAYSFIYGDASEEEFAYFGTADVVSLVDVTNNLAPGKMLVGFGLYGNSGGSTTFDNFSIAQDDEEPPGVPAPATLFLFGIGLAGLGWSRRKKA